MNGRVAPKVVLILMGRGGGLACVIRLEFYPALSSKSLSVPLGDGPCSLSRPEVEVVQQVVLGKGLSRRSLN